MDHPFLAGFLIIFVVWVIWQIAEKWSWSPAIAVLCFVVLTLESLWHALLRALQ